MKRSPLRRRTPLRRTGWPKRSSTARRAGYSQSWNWTMERARWRCEVVVDGVACICPATQAHHILRRAQGGLDEPANLLAVCTDHHAYIHAHPAWAYAAGYLKRSSA